MRSLRAKAMRETPGCARTRLRISDSIEAICSKLRFNIG
jgi:hypothetical protein